MSNLAFDFKFVAPKKITDPPSVCGDELQMQIVSEQGIYVFFRGQLFAQYRRDDHYSRNIILVQLFLCHKVPQKILAQVFGLTVPHLSSLIGNYRREGSAGVEDHIGVRINNNQKIKGKIAKAIIRQLEVAKSSRPTYRAVAKVLKQKYKVDISWSTIGDWWRQYEREHKAEKELQRSTEPKQETLLDVEVSSEQESENGSPQATLSDSDTRSQVGEQWQPNHVAGSFLLYGMLEKSAFLKPFFTGLRNAGQTGRQCIERVILTLFFSHALRLKSIEQTKRLASAHFGPLVLGDFSRQQSLRYAIDGITAHKKFDEVISQHYKNLGVHTDLGDGIYYTDGHFSCYYGKQAIPKGYDARRQRPARGRNTIYLHNSLGHNILSFESPTNTSLSVDIDVLLEKMKRTYGDVKGKTLFFDRGGFSATCFKAIKSKEMYFGTYLKHRKKDREIDAELFKVQEVEIEGKKISNHIYEKARQSKSYGSLRTIIFIGKQGKQIPVITTNLDLSAGEIVARLQKRWVEENGFKSLSAKNSIIKNLFR